MPNAVALKGKDIVTDQETLHAIEEFRPAVTEEAKADNIALDTNVEISTDVSHTVTEKGVYNLTYRITALAEHDDPSIPQKEAKGEVRLYLNGALISLLQRFNMVFHKSPFDAGYSFPIALNKNDVLDVRIISSKKITLKNVQQTFHIHKT